MIYAVSDLHGDWEKYHALLERLSRTDPEYTLYILGDSIDRGDSGCRILLDAMQRPNVISLLGNHELNAALCLPWLLQEVTDQTLAALSKGQIGALNDWLCNGGSPTLRELSALTPEDRQDILDYFREMDVYAEVDTGGRSYLLTHAGLDNFDPDKAIDEYALEDFLFGRSVLEQAFYPDQYLVYGHTPTRVLHEQLGEAPADDVIFHENKIIIDCGCGHGGRLGCLNLDTLEVFYL